MPFADSTLDRVMGALSLPVSVYYKERVQQSLDHVATHGGDNAIARIEGYLDKYEQLETALFEEGKTSNGALIRADVLEWQPGQKTASIKQQLLYYRDKIASALLLQLLLKGNPTKQIRLDGGSSGVRLVR